MLVTASHMKATSNLICAAAVLSFVLTASAEEKKAPTEPAKPAKSCCAKKQSTAKQSSDQVVVTGSYIPRNIRTDGQITDGPYPVAVIDSDFIKRTGAQDITEALRKSGVGR
jgi:hypothetical protein